MMKPVVLCSMFFGIWALQPAYAADVPANAASSPRLEIARQLVEKLAPKGAMREIFDSMSTTMGQSMIDQILPPEARSEALKQDPKFETKMQQAMQITYTEMGQVMTEVEPDIKEAIAKAYAARLSETELRDTVSFFNTPSGAVFARSNLTITASPEYMQSVMSTLMPKVQARMPIIVEKLKAVIGPEKK